MLACSVMHLINEEPLDRFASRRRDAADAILRWKELVRSASWRSPHDVRFDVSNVKRIDNDIFQFKIVRNHYRLVAQINFAQQRVMVLFIGTHAEYDRRYG